MIDLETRTKEHFSGATKSVSLLRVDLLEAHKRLSDASCAGQFKEWLNRVDIPRSTAYYLLGKKGKDGKFSAEGTGKWGAADPKRLTAAEKSARLKKVREQRKKSTVKYLTSLGDEAFDLLADSSPAGKIALVALKAVRDVDPVFTGGVSFQEQLKGAFSSIWKTRCPDDGELFPKGKAFNLAEALEQEEHWKKLTGEIRQTQLGDEALLRMPASELEATIAALKAAEANQQPPSTQA